MFDTPHAHITAWVIGLILFIVALFLYQSGKQKGFKIAQMSLRLFYLLIIASGVMLFVRHSSFDPESAVVVDVREGRLLTEFPAIYRKLKATRGLDLVLIFLEASEPALVRALQRDAAPASAREGSLGDRRHPRRAHRDARYSPHGRSHRRHVRHDALRAAPRVHQRGRRPRAWHPTGRHDPELRIQARHPGGLRPAVRRALPSKSPLCSEAAAPYRTGSRRRPIPGALAGDAGFSPAYAEP